LSYLFQHWQSVQQYLPCITLKLLSTSLSSSPCHLFHCCSCIKFTTKITFFSELLINRRKLQNLTVWHTWRLRLHKNKEETCFDIRWWHTDKSKRSVLAWVFFVWQQWTKSKTQTYFLTRKRKQRSLSGLFQHAVKEEDGQEIKIDCLGEMSCIAAALTINHVKVILFNCRLHSKQALVIYIKVQKIPWIKPVIKSFVGMLVWTLPLY